MKIYQNWNIFQMKTSGHWYFNKGYVCNIQERTSKSWADCNKHKYYIDIGKSLPVQTLLWGAVSSSNRSTELQQTVYGSLFHITFSWSCFELFILASLSILKYWEPFTCFKILEAKILHHITYIPRTVKLFKEKNIRGNFQKLKSKEAHYMETMEGARKCSKDTENSCRKKCPLALYTHTHIIRRPIM